MMFNLPFNYLRGIINLILLECSNYSIARDVEEMAHG